MDSLLLALFVLLLLALPLLQAEVVPRGWVDEAAFIAGYGAKQAVPGPLFTFTVFLGASMAPGAAGLGYAITALLSIFASSFLLARGVLPFQEALRTSLRRSSTMRTARSLVATSYLNRIPHSLLSCE